jgi:spore photoproduct lyase
VILQTLLLAAWHRLPASDLFGQADVNFELDNVFIEEEFRAGRMARRVVERLPSHVPVEYVADGRPAAMADRSRPDSFAAGKRRLILMRRRSPFLMACPAGSGEFACCGYLVLTLASNCPMDCAYCFLQEYVADNPGFQVYANYADAFDELEALARKAPNRNFRVGTGELADSLACDTLTGLSLELVDFFARQHNLVLELKTKTDEIENLLTLDPKGQVMVSWTLSPPPVFASSEHRSAPPAARIKVARRVADAGYGVAFHLDPVIAYPAAERDYLELLDNLFAAVDPRRIRFISIGGLRMSPGLRAAARRRFPADPMLAGEEVLSPDGRYRTFTPARARLFRVLSERIRKQTPALPVYLCMESATMSERIFGARPPAPAALGELLASSSRR